MEPLLVVDENTLLRVVIRRMLVCRVKAAAVLDDRGLLVGLITGAELVQAEQRRQAPDRLSGSAARDVMRDGVVTVMDHELQADAAQRLQGRLRTPPSSFATVPQSDSSGDYHLKNCAHVPHRSKDQKRPPPPGRSVGGDTRESSETKR